MQVHFRLPLPNHTHYGALVVQALGAIFQRWINQLTVAKFSCWPVPLAAGFLAPESVGSPKKKNRNHGRKKKKKARLHLLHRYYYMCCLLTTMASISACHGTQRRAIIPSQSY